MAEVLLYKALGPGMAGFGAGEVHGGHAAFLYVKVEFAYSVLAGGGLVNPQNITFFDGREVIFCHFANGADPHCPRGCADGQQGVFQLVPGDALPVPERSCRAVRWLTSGRRKAASPAHTACPAVR